MPRKKQTETSPVPNPQVLQKLPLAEFSERAYLHYSMYVILDRALPNLADGLKPVQRRIVYAMSDLGLHATAKFKKSARTVGDVLGKFHPHGDSACYEAMVLMAQPFSYRYPLIDGQGNWGSQDDPKSFAAMRYTESRLTRYAQLLLEELEQGTTEWVPNFDGTLNEPKLLPARLPNVLLNGGSGIAVGMATDIPPHNVREVVSACIRILENENTTLKTICKHIKAPDFPNEAEIITPINEIQDIYRTGTGSLRQRAVWHKEGGDIIISALPYQVSGSKIQEQVAAQMIAKKLPLVTDLRDESDHENPTRLAIEPRSSRVNADELMQHLFATTDLERSYRINLNMIGLDGRPRVFDLKTLLTDWLNYRVATVTLRLKFRLEKVVSRLHILDGLHIAFLNLDEVIKVIRAEDKPKPALMKQFSLSDEQAEAILELKLRQLAKLEEIKIIQQQKELNEEQKRLNKLLKSKQSLKELVRDELIADAEEYGDPRRSPLAEREAAKAMKVSDLTLPEPITVILSSNGWIRAAKGTEVNANELSYKSGDQFLCAVSGKTNNLLLAIDSFGRSYTLTPHTLPSARGFGEPLSSNFTPQAGALFCGLMMGEEQKEYLLCTDEGHGFVVKLGDLTSRIKAGKATLRVPEGVKVLVPQPVVDYEMDAVAVITSIGRLLIFAVNQLSRLAKGKGTKLMNIPKDKYQAGEERIVDFAVFRKGESLRITCEKQHYTLKPTDFDAFVGSRAARGQLLPKGFREPLTIDALSDKKKKK